MWTGRCGGKYFVGTMKRPGGGIRGNHKSYTKQLETVGTT